MNRDLNTRSVLASRLLCGLLDVGYLLAGVVMVPWMAYRLSRTRGWHSLPARFGVGLGAGLDDTIWLHGSSAGEVSLLKPLVALLERDFPGVPLVISTCTSTGRAAALRAYRTHRVVLFPLDLSFVARHFLRRFKPRVIIIVESEFWPNFLLVAQQERIPSVLLNGKMSEQSTRAYSRTRIVPRALRSMTRLAVQSEEHAVRLRRLRVPVERISVTGNMKYDLSGTPDDPVGIRTTIRERLGYAPSDIVVIGGSLHEGEHEALVAAFAALPVLSRVALIIVPRYPEDAPSMADHCATRGHEVVLKTRLDRGEAAWPGRDAVLVVDTVGELGSLYAAADIAFVGGSLIFRGSNKGGHNLMEPARCGLAMLFGPYNFSFKETVKDLLEAEAAIEVCDEKALATALAELVVNGERRRLFGQRARQVVQEGSGATERNYRMLAPLLNGE